MSRSRDFSVVGRPRRRVDGRAKVKGQTRFADDLALPGMLHCKLLRSPHPHARIVSLDTRRAEALPGVRLVLVGRDIPGEFGILPVSQDEEPLCRCTGYQQIFESVEEAVRRIAGGEERP